MGENSKIEWTDNTFNPWVGCTKVSPACDHCYAEGWAKRTGQDHLWQGERRRTSARNWQQPIKWNKKAIADGVRRRVFCASLADVFDNQVPKEWRRDLFSLIRETPHLDWLLLTKRPQNIVKMLPDATGESELWPWSNVWLGTTAENQEKADERVPELLATPAVVRFVSAEPLLGPIDFTSLRNGASLGEGQAWIDATQGWAYESSGDGCSVPTLDWIIAGGESGPGARPMHPEWARSIRDQCAAAGVAFFFKQWGEWLPGEVYSKGSYGGFTSHQDGTHGIHVNTPDHWWSGDAFGGVISSRIGKKRAGRTLDGLTHDDMPPSTPPAPLLPEDVG